MRYQPLGCQGRKWKQGQVPTPNDFGGCGNPKKVDGTSPDAFFAPCAGQAYTFPTDKNALSHDKCASGIFNCKVLANGK